MQGVPGRSLSDLLAATEAVGDDQPVGGSLADRGQKLKLPNSHRNVIFIVLETEGSGHAAAARRGALKIYAQPPQHRFFRGHLHQRLVMAMAVEDSFTLKPPQGNIWSLHL